MSDNKVVTIDRTEWMRGAGDNYLSCDLDGIGQIQRCCLGFHSIQIDGYTDETMEDIGEPSNLPNTQVVDGKTVVMKSSLVEEPYEHLTILCLHWAKQAMKINDDASLTEENREEMITKLAKENGYDYKFIN